MIELGDISNCDFGGAHLVWARISPKKSENATFAGAEGTDTDFRDGTFMNCDFSNAKFTKADFRGATFGGGNGTKFRGAELRLCIFGRIDITRMDFDGADLTDAEIDKNSPGYESNLSAEQRASMEKNESAYQNFDKPEEEARTDEPS